MFVRDIRCLLREPTSDWNFFHLNSDLNKFLKLKKINFPFEKIGKISLCLLLKSLSYAFADEMLFTISKTNFKKIGSSVVLSYPSLASHSKARGDIFNTSKVQTTMSISRFTLPYITFVDVNNFYLNDFRMHDLYT